jgi:hypothetical protein
MAFYCGEGRWRRDSGPRAMALLSPVLRAEGWYPVHPVRSHEWRGRRAAAGWQGWVVSARAAALSD